MSTMVLTSRRDPFTTLDATLRRAFPATSRWTFGPIPAATGFNPAAEIVRDGDDALVRVDLPGIDLAKDVTVEIDGGRLVIKGERRDERSEDRDGRALRETRYGSFRRSFTLPERVDAGAVSATYDAGVLTVRVIGAYATAEPQRIAVTVAPAVAPAAAPEPVAIDEPPAGAADSTVQA